MYQLTSHLLMIRPVNFGFNQQTADSNAFQQRSASEQNIQQKALAEFNAFADTLLQNGLDVIIINDTAKPHTPDSIFPNNWVSFHENGDIFLYPMQAENRRLERREDIIGTLKQTFAVNRVEDLSNLENGGLFLEGTGSLVLDRQHQIAYACLSPRTHVAAVDAFCHQSGYKAVLFNALDQNGKAIYHTNVLMCMGDAFVVICMDAITSESEKATLLLSFKQTDKQVITISQQQLNNFAGNMLEVQNKQGEKLLVMSARAYQSLTREQIEALQKHCRIIYASLDVIENVGGGSARCMLAEVHLPLRK